MAAVSASQAVTSRLAGMTSAPLMSLLFSASVPGSAAVKATFSPCSPAAYRFASPHAVSAAGAANDTMAAAQQVAAALMGGVTAVVLLEGLLDAAAIRSSDERQEVR